MHRMASNGMAYIWDENAPQAPLSLYGSPTQLLILMALDIARYSMPQALKNKKHSGQDSGGRMEGSPRY